MFRGESLRERNRMGNALKMVDMPRVAMRGRHLVFRFAATTTILIGEMLTMAGQSMAIDFDGTARPAAMDQPQINILLRTSPTGAPLVGDPETIDLGGGIIITITAATINIPAYLYTGSSGTLMSTSTAERFHVTTPT